MKKVEINPITCNDSLRQVLFEDFKSLGKELPIKGGWGYAKDSAIVIDKYDSSVDKQMMFDGVGLEYIIAEKRIYEELIIFRRKGDQYSCIEIKLKEQRLIEGSEGKIYDHLIFNVSAIHDSQKESENPESVFYEPEFWFEISSFT